MMKIKKTNPTLLQACLDELIQFNQQAQHCFRSASKASGDLSLKHQLVEYEQVHQTLVQELTVWTLELDLPAGQRQLNAITMTLPGRSTFQYALATQDRYAILAECQTQLSQTLEGYEEVLKQELPGHLPEDLLTQAEIVRQAYSAIHRMCVMALPQFPHRRPAKISTINMTPKAVKPARTGSTFSETASLISHTQADPTEPLATT